MQNKIITDFLDQNDVNDIEQSLDNLLARFSIKINNDLTLECFINEQNYYITIGGAALFFKKDEKDTYKKSFFIKDNFMCFATNEIFHLSTTLEKIKILAKNDFEKLINDLKEKALLFHKREL